MPASPPSPPGGPPAEAPPPARPARSSAILRSPLFRASAVIGGGIFVLAGSGLEASLASARVTPTAPVAAAPRCGPGSLPDDDICVHIPRDDEDGPAALARENAHRERSGAWRTYEQIPRRPERPENYDLYRFPVPPGMTGGRYVISGYDLDQPDRWQRRGARLRAIGHGGVDIPEVRGTPIHMVPLEHQQGDAEVVYAGPLFGTTVVLKSTLREAGALRDYLILFGHLDAIAPGIAGGQHVPEGALVGNVGDTGSPELVHLHLEIRRVRDGVDAAATIRSSGPGMVLADWVTIVCDPRNVLPLAR
jgi:hypothetical protein